MGKSDVRRDWIMQQLHDHGSIKLADVVHAFGVSEVTVRRDLELLENEKKCIRTLGGAVIETTKTEIPFYEKLEICAAEKKQIADKAVALIRDGDVIGLTGGTTNYYIAQRLRQFRSLTVVTNAVNLAFELVGNPGIEIIVTGGVIRSQSYELSGPLADATLHQVNIQTTFAAVDGISLTRGLTTFSGLEAQTNRIMMEKSQQTYVVADHTKFNQSALFVMTELSSVNGIITDAKIDQEMLAWYQNSGVVLL